MSLFNVFRISSEGMTAHRERLEAAAANLANANTTRTAEGGPYRRRDVVFEAIPLEDAGGADSDEGLSEDPPIGVRATIHLAGLDQSARQHQPGHPDADAEGYVTLPAVNPLEETVNMLSAARAFEANATAFNTAKELARASLRLGENG
ncbi:MAG: flagellar basal body rod protein FlgC [Blastocatellia bacterium]|nr:flagellar basal body rod protein FlgC [Blastocatellia bacterium]